MNIGKTISTLRKEKNMTQSEVADKLGVSYQAVSKWERDESLPDITLLPEIADLFGITIDQLLRGGLEMNDQEIVHAKEIVESVSNEDMNDQITEFVNQQFESGYANGNPPTADDLGEKISDFVNKTITQSFASAFEGLMPFMKPNKIKKMVKDYKADFKSFSSNAYEYMDNESLNQLFDSIDEVDEEVYEKILEIIAVCDSSMRDRIVELLSNSDLEDLELAGIMPFINHEQKYKVLAQYLENTNDYEQIEEIICFLDDDHKHLVLDYILNEENDIEQVIEYLPFLNHEHKDRLIDYIVNDEITDIDLEEILVFLNKEQKNRLLSNMKELIDYDTLEDLAPFLDDETLHAYIIKYIEEENDEDISGLYPFLSSVSLGLLKNYYVEHKMVDELEELFDFV